MGHFSQANPGQFSRALKARCATVNLRRVRRRAWSPRPPFVASSHADTGCSCGRGQPARGRRQVCGPPCDGSVRRGGRLGGPRARAAAQGESGQEPEPGAPERPGQGGLVPRGGGGPPPRPRRPRQYVGTAIPNSPATVPSITCCRSRGSEICDPRPAPERREAHGALRRASALRRPRPCMARRGALPPGPELPARHELPAQE